MRTLNELTSVEDPAWPDVQAWIANAPEVVVLPAEREDADAALQQLQVTVRSPMGAIVHHTGGLLVDHGWLRVLGAGHPRLNRSLPGWNHGRVPFDSAGRPALLLIADDVLGGHFAVNGGALGDDLGKVHYLAPDTLKWENLGVGYTGWLTWALSAGLAKFYGDLRWPGWEDEVEPLTGNTVLSVLPFLWAAGPPIGERARRPIPVAEGFDLLMEMRQQIGG